MHRALGIPEIVQEVVWTLLEHSRNEWDNREAYISWSPFRSKVLPLALTCRCFCEPALDAVWAFLEGKRGLLPLFSLISGFESKAGNIVGQICQTDLERFRFYSKRIRMLDLPRDDPVTTSAYLRVLHALQTHHLLPNLRHLRLHIPSKQESYILLLQPNLVHLAAWMTEADIPSKPFNASTIVDCIAEYGVHSCLQSITLGAYISSSDLRNLMQIRGLKHLDIDHRSRFHNRRTPMVVGDNFSRQLLSSHTLRYFSLTGPLTYMLGEKKTNTVLPVVFPDLEELVLQIDIEDLTAAGAIIFRNSKFLNLKSFTLYTASFGRLGPGYEDDWIGFLADTRSSFGDELRAVSLSHVESPEGRTSLLPFLPFVHFLPQSVETLDIEEAVFQPIRRADFVQLLKTHVNLVKLTWFFEQSPKLEFEALADISNFAPRLTEVTIEVDLEHLPSVDNLPLSDHNLQSLRFHTILPQDTFKVAQLIDHLFPKLVHLEEGMTYDQEDYERLEQLQLFIEGLRRAREHERRRVADGYS